MVEPDAATETSGTPSTIERSPLDFSNENPSQQINEGDGMEDQVLETRASEVPLTGHASTMGVAPNIVIEEEDVADVPFVSKRRRKRVDDGVNANAPSKVLRKDFDVSRPAPSTFRGKSFASTGLEAGSTLSAPASQETPASTIDPGPSSKGATIAKDPNSKKSSSFTSFAGSPGGYFSKLLHLPNEEFLNQYNVNLARQVAMGSQLRLRFKQEVRLLKKAKEKVAKRDKRIHAREKEIKKLDQEVQGLRNQTRNLETLLEAEVYTLQAQVTGEEQIKAAFEEFKKREDDKVEQRCSKIDARLDVLSIDFNKELYPHMLTAIAGCRWVIGHGLRLAIMKCAESTDLRQAFANVVSAWIAKGMSGGLKHGVEHGKAQLDLEVIEAYDPEADAKYFTALHALKDLEYPLIDHLEKFKDAPIDLIMASLHLEKVRDSKDPWASKEEMLLEDVIMSNVSRAEKKKKCWVICRTHRIGSAQHPRSDGILMSVPIVAPQGLAILLIGVSTRTETTEDEASPS
ncbi:hypothetical protein Tco_1305838 [Tanacetum coccineum]